MWNGVLVALKNLLTKLLGESKDRSYQIRKHGGGVLKLKTYKKLYN